MSIEAIKEALEALGEADAKFAASDKDSWTACLIEIGHRTQGLASKCTPPAIRSLIERLEAAEKDAERYRWLRDSHPADGEVWAAMGIPNTPAGISCWRHEELDATIDSAMAGGLAEGVSDGRSS